MGNLRCKKIESRPSKDCLSISKNMSKENMIKLSRLLKKKYTKISKMKRSIKRKLKAWLLRLIKIKNSETKLFHPNTPPM